MSQNQVVSRLGQRVTKRPRHRKLLKIPIAVDHGGNVEHKTKRITENLSPRYSFKMLRKTLGGQDRFRMECHPNSTISVMDLFSTLRIWGIEGWVPDVIVIDYADILADPPGRGDGLENIDMTWKLLRRMSQEYHCLVLTATQSNAAAYRDKKLLGRRHFSGRKTKLAHVTGMIGLNVSPEDKAKGITRLNWVVRREGAYNEHQGHVVAGCLAISCPAMKSE